MAEKRVNQKQQARDLISRLPDHPKNPAKLQDKVAESSAVVQEIVDQNGASEPEFVLYKLSDRSIVQKMPMINPVNIKATDGCFSKDDPRTTKFPDYNTGGVEAVKNEVWGNTFFTSKRAATLLGPELAGRFRYKPSNQALQSSDPQPDASKRPKRQKSPIHRRKALHTMDDEGERIHCNPQ